MVISWPMLKIPKGLESKRDWFLGVSSVPAARSAVAFGIVHCEGILNSMLAFTRSVKELSEGVHSGLRRACWQVICI